MSNDIVQRLLDQYRSTGESYLQEAAAEIERLRGQLQSARHALMEVRICLHASGRRPEECYEMSVVDDALREGK